MVSFRRVQILTLGSASVITVIIILDNLSVTNKARDPWIQTPRPRPPPHSAVDQGAEIKVSKMLDEIPYTIPHSSPELYQGPILESWPPGRDRMLKNYIRPKENVFLTTPKPLKNCRVLVVVYSTLESFDSRFQIRETWMKMNKTGDIRVLFMVGIRETEKILWKFRKEVDKNGDIIQAPVVEHYHNLTLKAMFSLKYFLDESNFEGGRNPDYLFKTDDDTFVNLVNFYPTIDLQKKNNDKGKFILGAVMGARKNPKFPLKVSVQRNPPKENRKWFCPKYMYNLKYYPTFVSGSGYIIPKESVLCLYQAGLRLPYFHLEDVFITGFAAEWCRIPRIDSLAFYPQALDLEIIDPKNDLLYHYILSRGKDLLMRLFSYFELEKKLSQRV